MIVNSVVRCPAAPQNGLLHCPDNTPAGLCDRAGSHALNYVSAFAIAVNASRLTRPGRRNDAANRTRYAFEVSRNIARWIGRECPGMLANTRGQNGYSIYRGS